MSCILYYASFLKRKFSSKFLKKALYVRKEGKKDGRRKEKKKKS